MPTYDYECSEHGAYDVIKGIKSYDGKDPCPTCGCVGIRVFSSRIIFAGTSVQHSEYNYGLGCVTKNAKHRAEIAKQRGLEEIGNEKLSSMKKWSKEKQEEKKKRERMSDSDIRHLAESWK